MPNTYYCLYVNGEYETLFTTKDSLVKFLLEEISSKKKHYEVQLKEEGVLGLTKKRYNHK